MWSCLNLTRTLYSGAARMLQNISLAPSRRPSLPPRSSSQEEIFPFAPDSCATIQSTPLEIVVHPDTFSTNRFLRQRSTTERPNDRRVQNVAGAWHGSPPAGPAGRWSTGRSLDPSVVRSFGRKYPGEIMLQMAAPGQPPFWPAVQLVVSNHRRVLTTERQNDRRVENMARARHGSPAEALRASGTLGRGLDPSVVRSFSRKYPGEMMLRMAGLGRPSFWPAGQARSGLVEGWRSRLASLFVANHLQGRRPLAFAARFP